MSVFKKLVGFLFEEEDLEEDNLEEDELEDVFVPEPQATVKAAPRQPQAAEVKEAPRHTAVVEEEAAAPTTSKETRFKSIEISEQEPPKRVYREKERTAHGSRTMKRGEPIRKEFEFTPVISPIFGVDEDTPSASKKNAKVDIPPLRATIAKAPKQNPLGTILSPMYGANELEEFEEEAKQRLETENEAKFIVDDQEDVEIAYDDEEIDETEVIRVPLEELLSNDEHPETADDLRQFSLFGDEEVISTEESSESYTIKE